jgi:HEAT repeat protein
MDGPFYAIKRVNPYYRAEWKKDRELGPTFEDRLSELELLKSQLAGMSPEEQQQWSTRLEKIVQDDASSEMRARAVDAIAGLPYESATRALNSASADEIEKVRLAACRAWKIQKGEAARDMLLSLAQKDESSSVRQAAVDSLSIFNEQEVQAALAQMLDDRSPAVQFQVTQSLKQITGRDYGGDFESWRKFLAGEQVPEPPPISVADKVWNSLPTWW